MADRERDPDDPLGRPGKSTARQLRTYAAVVVAILALILIIQNSQSVEFNFFFAKTNTPLFFGLLIAFVLGALVGWLLPRVRGSRHRRDDGKD